MKVSEVINNVCLAYPNQIEDEQMIIWLKRLDQQITEDIIKTHELPEDYEEPDFDSYDMHTKLIVPDLYAEMYEAYLKMKIAQHILESKRYAMEQTNYNNMYITFQAWYNRNHMPIGVKHIYR